MAILAGAGFKWTPHSIYAHNEEPAGHHAEPAQENTETAPRSELCDNAQKRIDKRAENITNYATQIFTYISDAEINLKNYIQTKNLVIKDGEEHFSLLLESKNHADSILNEFKSKPTLLNCEIDSQDATIKPLKQAAIGLSRALLDYRERYIELAEIVLKSALRKDSGDITE